MCYTDQKQKSKCLKNIRLTRRWVSLRQHDTVPPKVSAASAPRRIYLKPADFLKQGYTERCKGCAWIQHGLGAKTGHNNECRKRSEKALAESDDPGDRTRVETQKSKIDKFVFVERNKYLMQEENVEDTAQFETFTGMLQTTLPDQKQNTHSVKRKVCKTCNRKRAATFHSK